MIAVVLLALATICFHWTIELHVDRSFPKNDLIRTTSATSGTAFKISKLRSVSQDRLRFQNGVDSAKKKESRWPSGDFWNRRDCTKWAATTTAALPPTVAIKQFLGLGDWCLVVVTDTDGPESHQAELLHENKVVFLTRERQVELAEQLLFVKKMPLRHFARKSIAYLYAIANGATFIWDFDGANIRSLNETLAKYTDASHQTRVVSAVDTRNNSDCTAFNPYPFFRSSEKSVWPRGFPLNKVRASECQLATTYCLMEVPTKNIGIFQSLADMDPDVDAVYRLTEPLPVSLSGAVENVPVLIPPDTMSPMNARASLVSRIGFWSLFLPSTVDDRVSDIWRSYIAQTLAKRCGMLMAFVGPHAIQERGAAYSDLLDIMVTERQLYERSGSLISYLLREWAYKNPNGPLASAWERLYVDLYERGIIEWDDVELAQLWISTLQSVGYNFSGCETTSSFVAPMMEVEHKTSNCQEWSSALFKEAVEPDSRNCTLDNVVLVGQFNYNSGAGLVLHWVERWREIFHHVEVRGPFDEANMNSLRDAGVKVFNSVADRGFYSPMKNLADSLRLHANDSSICGALIIHDDLLVNMTYLKERGFPSDSTIFAQIPTQNVSRPYFTLFPNGTLKLKTNDTLIAAETYYGTLYDWSWWNYVVPNAAKAVASAQGREYYINADGGLDFCGDAPSDFMYVPTSLAVPFASYAEWMYDNKIMLEAATPTVIWRLQNEFKAAVQFVNLCTEYDSRIRRNAKAWVSKCFEGHEYATVHPVKITMGKKKWNLEFNKVVLGK